MLPLQFFGQNIHFAISLFAALVFFAVFWLQLDAWSAKHSRKELAKWVGFGLIALSFVVSATQIEQPGTVTTPLGHISAIVAVLLRIAGYLGVIIGQLLDPLLEVPKLAGLNAADFTKPEPLAPTESVKESKPLAKKKPAKKLQAAILGFGSFNSIAHFVVPIGSLSIAWLYYRRATTGLERHYKSVALAFGLLCASDIVALASIWQSSNNPSVVQLVTAYKPLWALGQILLLASAVVLGRWVWKYLTRRFMSQLFMIFTSLTLAIFLLTTISFSYLLVRNIQQSSLDNLSTAASVLQYAVDSKKSETTANTQSIAENPAVARATQAGDHKALVDQTSSFLQTKKLSSLVITNINGQVLLRAEDPSRYGDSLSSDTLVRRALIGQASSSVTSHEGVLAPQISIRSAVPIRSAGGTIVGTATTSLVINNSFVDGIKQSTGLDSAIYAGNVRSATTFVAPDGRSRWIGVKETNSVVNSDVLKKQQTYKGSLSIQNRQYLAVYAPLKDVDNSVVGMLFIGKPSATVLQAAAHSIQLTFVVTAVLLLLAIIPAYLMSRYITKQLS